VVEVEHRDNCHHNVKELVEPSQGRPNRVLADYFVPRTDTNREKQSVRHSCDQNSECFSQQRLFLCHFLAEALIQSVHQANIKVED